MHQVDPECCFNSLCWKRTVYIVSNWRQNEVNASKIAEACRSLSIFEALTTGTRRFTRITSSRQPVLFLSPGTAEFHDSDDSKPVFRQSHKTSQANPVCATPDAPSMYQNELVNCLSMSIFEALVGDFRRFST